MDTDFFVTQKKKLLFVAIFLIAVAVLIGGEDDPGIVARYDEQHATSSHARDDGRTYSSLPKDLPMRASRGTKKDPQLEAWYAESASDMDKPQEPVDPSEGVNDTVPAVSTDPVVL